MCLIRSLLKKRPSTEREMCPDHLCWVQLVGQTTENAEDSFFARLSRTLNLLFSSEFGKTTCCIPCPFSVPAATLVVVEGFVVVLEFVVVVGSFPRLYSGGLRE